MPRPKNTDLKPTRLAIVAAAEELFRKVGYFKTTITDIASQLGMSPANIYRFFRSKSEINGVICDRLMAEVETCCSAAITPSASATANLASVLLAFHRHSRAHFLSNQGMYDMMAAGIEQHWPAIRSHTLRMADLIEGILRQGVDQGEFQPGDTAKLAALVLTAVSSLLDPRYISRALEDCVALGVQEHMESDLLGIVALLTRGMTTHRSESSR